MDGSDKSLRNLQSKRSYISSSIEEESDSDDGNTSGSEFGVFSSLHVLEDALMLKRGLSNFYNGKSKSFNNLVDVKTVQELAKPDHPKIKRRRLRAETEQWCSKRKHEPKRKPHDDHDHDHPERPSANITNFVKSNSNA